MDRMPRLFWVGDYNTDPHRFFIFQGDEIGRGEWSVGRGRG